MFYCTQNQTVKETALLGVKDKHRLSLQIQLALKKTPNFPVLHGVLQRNVTITLVWGGMWENTLDRAPFLYEPFPPELAITQRLARAREAEGVPSHRKPGGFPSVWQGCVTSGGHADHHVPVSSGQAVHMCAFAGCSNPGGIWRSALHLNRDSCVVLLWCAGLCSDQHGVGLHVQHVDHLYRREWLRI